MFRKFYNTLLSWKKQDQRKPLLLQGARQAGKTYLLEQFARECFEQEHIFDFLENSDLHSVFENNLQPEKIIRDLSVISGKTINPSTDLIIFDEVQSCPNALTSLKYFCQKLPKSYLCASGSLLGIGLSSGSFPVGKVERHTLYPMDFEEFLQANDQMMLLDVMRNTTLDSPIIEAIHNKIWEYYKYYMITGGLPEVVKSFIARREDLNDAFSEVRRIQNEIHDGYIDDIAKHSGKIKAVRIEAVFKNTPVQLARERKGINKFIFKDVLPTASRYSVLEGPIEWLIKAGLVIKVPICEEPAIPLQAHCDEKRFKLYLFDVGILGAMLHLSPKSIYLYDYGSYKGYFAENLVLTELTSYWKKTIFSWERNTSEIEFLLENENEILPIEVKAGLNTKAKSLSVYKERYAPTKSVILCGRVMDRRHKNIVPLYLANRVHSIL